MATTIIAGRSFEIAPYKIGALRKAAPHIDAINASATSIDSIEGLIENATHIVAIIAIGLGKVDAALTPEALDEMIGADDIQSLGVTLREIMVESGLAPKGEAMAPSETVAEGASQASSETSSSS
jgi:hypothetical protein